ncbi:MAG TPA: hypothetical protein VHZ07_27005 [Bryobacteraceae bacterium]|jgi:hypothetical protein|nr:hypothetical protein [Bryobacteraceae bacterium]
MNRFDFQQLAWCIAGMRMPSLFSVQGRRITIRFHPQHARLRGLSKVKQQVRIALHRSRPDCQIEWIDKA